MKKMSRIISKLKKVKGVKQGCEAKLELVVKAFVIENMYIFCDGQSAYKQRTLDHLIEARNMPD